MAGTKLPEGSAMPKVATARQKKRQRKMARVETEKVSAACSYRESRWFIVAS